MKTINRVQLLGYLGSDPEIKVTEKTTVASFSIATSWFKESGEESVTWHRVVAFGKLADICSERLKKGSLLLLDEGHLDTSKWEKDGHKFERTVVVADKLIFFSQQGEKSAKSDLPKSEAMSEPSQQADRAPEEKKDEEPEATDRQIWMLNKLAAAMNMTEQETEDLLAEAKTKKAATKTIDRLTKEVKKKETPVA